MCVPEEKKSIGKLKNCPYMYTKYAICDIKFLLLFNMNFSLFSYRTNTYYLNN